MYLISSTAVLCSRGGGEAVEGVGSLKRNFLDSSGPAAYDYD